MTTPIATDPLATVPVEEHPRILEAAQDERDAAYAKWIADDEPIVACEKASERAYLDTIAREVAAWHARQRPPVTPGFVDLESSDIATPETLTRAETCNCGHEKAAHAAAGHGACTAVLGEDARCVCRGYSRSDAIPETLTREEAIVAASHLSPAASSMIDLTDPRACLRSFESLRSAPPDFWKARDIVVAYVAHLDRLAAASPEQIAKDHAVGLYRKFDVRRTDGSSDPGGKHEDCEYFVLDWQHDPFTVPAVRAYADACEATYPALAADLRAKAESIAAAPPPIGPAARLTEEELAEIEARTADPPLAGDGPALRRLVAEVRALRAERDAASAALTALGHPVQTTLTVAIKEAHEDTMRHLHALRRSRDLAVIAKEEAEDAVDRLRRALQDADIDPDDDDLSAAIRGAARLAPAADASLEARAEIAREAWFGGYPHSAKLADLPAEKQETWLAVVRAVDASRPALTEEQAQRWAADLTDRLTIGPGTRALIGDALFAASRGEVPPASRDATEGLGPEPGILAPAASDAGPPPAPADHVLIPRAILERLAKAAASDAGAREARWAAERILQQAVHAAEPARTDPEAVRGETTRTASTNLHIAGAALVLRDIARSCAAITSDDAPARLELAPTALDLLRALGAHLTTTTLYEAGKRPQETTTARLTVDALEILARQSHDAEGPIVEPEPPPAILPHVLAALRRVRDALPTGDSGKHALTQALSQLEGARDMLAIGRVHAAIDILSDIEPEEDGAP